MDPGLEIGSRILAALVAAGDFGPSFMLPAQKKRKAEELAAEAALLTVALLLEFGWSAVNLPKTKGNEV